MTEKLQSFYYNHCTKMSHVTINRSCSTATMENLQSFYYNHCTKTSHVTINIGCSTAMMGKPAVIRLQYLWAPITQSTGQHITFSARWGKDQIKVSLLSFFAADDRF